MLKFRTEPALDVVLAVPLTEVAVLHAGRGYLRVSVPGLQVRAAAVGAVVVAARYGLAAVVLEICPVTVGVREPLEIAVLVAWYGILERLLVVGIGQDEPALALQELVADVLEARLVVIPGVGRRLSGGRGVGVVVLFRIGGRDIGVLVLRGPLRTRGVVGVIVDTVIAGSTWLCRFLGVGVRGLGRSAWFRARSRGGVARVRLGAVVGPHGVR